MIIKKGHGYFRKSKAYGLSSCIVLGTTLLLGTGVVSAQETTAKTDVKTEQVAKQETKTNSTESTKDDSNAKLLEAIKKAKENHVIVELTKDVNYKTANDFQVIATKLKDYCLNTGKDLVIEKLDFTKKKDNLISKRGKKYNEMLSTLAYSKFDSIVSSKCAKNRIFLHKVNPAWTSWIAKQKYCPKMKLNIHSGASYVIARRGMFLKDKVK